jgi:UDP-N-acetylmuramyl pentapeptide phosphotransferase/UDP-N-acetylglucosamine-1-phosphate transferase
MKGFRLLTYSFAFVASLLALFTYMKYVYMIGFPDGFMSERASAERILFSIFSGVSILFGFYFFYLGWILIRENTTKKVVITGLFYLLILMFVCIVDYYWQCHLMGDCGG